MKKKLLSIGISIIMASSMALPTFAAPVVSNNEIVMARQVSEEMCNADYWKETSMIGANRILATASDVLAYNASAELSEGTNRYDLENLAEPADYSTYRLDIKNFASIAGVSLDLAHPEKNYPIYIINEARTMDVREYYKSRVCADPTPYQSTDIFVYDEANLEHYIESPEVTKHENQYAICTTRADLTAFPVSDYLAKNSSSCFNNLASAMLCVNEPFVIQRECTVNGTKYYWGYSLNCTGWVRADSMGICDDKETWLAMWSTLPEDKDILVVTQNKIILEYSNDPSCSQVRLDMGTVLKMVPEQERKEFLAGLDGRNAYNNYVVYLPVRVSEGEAEGKCVWKKALISQHYNVSIGYVPLTEANLLEIAFSCLGDTYGWGGSAMGLDCTMYTRNLYRCFGYEMPRNTTWQPKVEGYTTKLSELATQAVPEGLDELAKKTFIENYKKDYVNTLPIGSLMYISGHAMIYIGSVDGMPYCISAVGTVVDNDDSIIQKIGSVIINPMTMKRGNGTTWMYNVTDVITFNPIRHTEHIPVTISGKEASCTSTGLTDGSICTLCNEVISEQHLIDKTEHAYGKWTTVVAAGCDHKGLEQRVCENCGVIKQREVKATGHDYDKWETLVRATCTQEGVRVRSCKNCNGMKVQRIAALGHQSVTDKKVAATALKTGLTEGSHCKRCGEILKKQKTISKLKATIKLSAKSRTLKAKKSYVLVVSGLAKGDYVKSVVSSDSQKVTVKKKSKNHYIITAKAKGKATITVKLASKKTAACKITVS